MASSDIVPIVPGFEAPKGNWIARNLRLINDDSKELFPPSAQGRRGDKFHTLYKVDYHDYPQDDYLEGLREKGKEPKRETIRDVLFGNSPSEVFQDWQVPHRLVPDVSQAEKDTAAYAAVVTGRRDKLSPRKPSLDRQATLPAIPATRERKLVQTPRALGVGRSNTTIDGSELIGTRERLRDSLQPHTVGVANEWLKKAPTADKKVIEKVLRMQEKKHQLDHALRKSLLPGARKSVEEWLETANEAERQVALKFFSSVAGARLMGSTQEEQKGRLQQVLRTLESHKGGAGGGNVRHSLDSQAGKESKLKFVNLLDDQTRANRWMYTTWHHLPEYRNDNPVNNWSSHYVRPHAPTPRHFVIHPDWG